MASLSLRLPDELEHRLTDEVRLSGQPRSQLIREALEQLLARRDRERLQSALMAAARALASDPEACDESLAVAADFLPLENEALERSEAGLGVDSQATGDGARWWC